MAIENIVNTESMMSTLSGFGFIAQILFMVLIFVVLGVVAITFMQYKYKVVMFEKRGDGNYRVINHRARQINERGVIKYKTLRGKYEFPPPGDNQMYVSGKKDFFMLWKDEQNIVRPITFSNPSGTIRVMDANMVRWALNQYRATEELYNKNTFWDKYGHIAVQIAFVGVMFIIFLILLNKMDGVAEAFNSIPTRIELAIPGGGAPPG